MEKETWRTKILRDHVPASTLAPGEVLVQHIYIIYTPEYILSIYCNVFEAGAIDEKQNKKIHCPSRTR